MARTNVTDDLVRRMRAMSAGGASIKDVATFAHLHYATARQILTGDKYPNAGGPLRPKLHRVEKDATPELVRATALKILADGTSIAANGCWHFRGSKYSRGYAILTIAGQRMAASRWAYRMFVGPIPEGLVVDHMCHNEDLSCAGGSKCWHRRCVRPEHLTVTDRGENSRRGRCGAYNLSKVTCPQGHVYTGANLRTGLQRGGTPYRRCRICSRRQARKSYRKTHPFPTGPAR